MIDEDVILKEEFVFLGNNRDELGNVFIYKNKILRAIYPEKTEYVKELLKSGLIDELVNQHLFPKTFITDYKIEGWGMVLEHERITPVVYPPQWSFDMLKDAAKAVLKVNEIAKEFGYQTMDCHGYNILFKNNQPVYIDLGSFIKVSKNFKGWFAYEEFLKYYYYPLKISAAGNFYFSRLILLQRHSMLHYAYYYHQYPLVRFIKQDKIDILLLNFYKFKLISFFQDHEIRDKAPLVLYKFIKFLKKLNFLPFQNIHFDSLRKKISNLKIKSPGTEWGNYHNVLQEDGNIKSTPRFDRIISLIQKFNMDSILELGGNQGVFSRIIAEKTNVEKIICTDYDETAVNVLYNQLKRTKYPITPAVLDFTSPNDNNYGVHVTERFKSDTVLALALTHHLILTQKMPINKVFEEVAKYSRKYVFIEFMPLGLYSENSKRKYIIPDWYNVNWFRDNFTNEFTLLHEEQLEKNRILFIGELKSPNA